MASAKSIDIANRAKQLYEARLRGSLEAQHPNWYAAIEPDSGEFFLGETMREAIDRARSAYPDRISFLLRIGHEAVFHIGGCG